MDFRNRRRQKTEPCACLRPLIRFWGLITSIVVFGVGADITFHRYSAGIYILILSIVIFLLEIKWVITLFVQLCTNNDYTNNCYQCWSYTKRVGGWRLSFFYIAAGVALIIWPHNLWLSHIAGGQLLILAVLRLCTVFRYSRGNKEDELLPQFDDSSNHQDTKYDNLNEVLDDSMPEPGQSLEDDELIEDF